MAFYASSVSRKSRKGLTLTVTVFDVQAAGDIFAIAGGTITSCR
jgi:hypothetical protein